MQAQTSFVNLYRSDKLDREELWEVICAEGRLIRTTIAKRIDPSDWLGFRCLFAFGRTEDVFNLLGAGESTYFAGFKAAISIASEHGNPNVVRVLLDNEEVFRFLMRSAWHRCTVILMS